MQVNELAAVVWLENLGGDGIDDDKRRRCCCCSLSLVVVVDNPVVNGVVFS